MRDRPFPESPLTNAGGRTDETVADVKVATYEIHKGCSDERPASDERWGRSHPRDVRSLGGSNSDCAAESWQTPPKRAIAADLTVEGQEDATCP